VTDSFEPNMVNLHEHIEEDEDVDYPDTDRSFWYMPDESTTLNSKE
jgi:hypothetical protein